MKIQNLAIIFLIIAIPIIMVLSYYMHLQEESLRNQIQYDSSLLRAAKDAINAFETNLYDLSLNKNDDVSENALISASINVFLTGVANNINVTGTAREYVSNYVPAISFLMYDGYYIYSKEYVPITIENDSGMTLYYDTTQNIIVDKQNENICLPIYEPQNASDGTIGEYKYTDKSLVEVKKNITFVTDINKAKKQYKPILSNKKKYTSRFVKEASKTDVSVEFTLDNKIGVYGKVNDNNVKKEGYLLWFNKDSQFPILNENSMAVSSGCKYNGTEIEAEQLSEQVIYFDGEDVYIGVFPYFYDSNHEKIYYDSEYGQYFIKGEQNIRKIIGDHSTMKAGEEGCYYKTVSVLWGEDDGTVEYKKIYQVINGIDKGKWYIDLSSNMYTSNEVMKFENQIDQSVVESLGIDVDPMSDYSAINYYVEAKAFTNFITYNLIGVKEKINNKQINYYENITIDNIFDISEDNNPESDEAIIVQYKRKLMREKIEADLNYSIYNYSRRKTNFRLPKIKENDWDRAFSNVSIIAFLQDIPIGIKEYNNYFLVSSSTNKSFVDADSFYFSGDDEYFHKLNCDKMKDVTYKGYRSIEYDVNTVKTNDGNVYYYQHDEYSKGKEINNINSERACYYCIINRAKFKKINDDNVLRSLKKAYLEALAREKYVLNSTLVEYNQQIENDSQEYEDEEEEYQDELEPTV